ncbi:NPCBM/NEW2 domain-containing protein [Deinococcus sonorensis]|uniref:NPCBM/NEW2 domain-containing protein n=2 Tax=Deinococcus sonorensis TaxID=309891 RepID=A0AAU7U634_9DEIO
MPVFFPGIRTQDLSLTLTATNGYGPIEFNTSNGGRNAGDGNTLTLNENIYTRGLGVHAGSEIHITGSGFTLPACSVFQARVGVDDEVNSNGSVVFQVYADGQRLYDSGVMTGTSAGQQVYVPIGGKHDLRFVVTNAGDGSSYDHADWINPTISCPPQYGQAGTVDRSYQGGGATSVGGVAAALDPDNTVLLLQQNGTSNTLVRVQENGQQSQVQLQLAARAVVVQPDHKILVGGQLNHTFAITRYNPDLTVDATYGKGGSVITNLAITQDGYTYDAGINALVLQPDGRLIAVGSAPGLYYPSPSQPSITWVDGGNYALARYTSSGQLDPSFGTGGVVNSGFSLPQDPATRFTEHARAVALQPDGKVVIGGVRYHDSEVDSTVVRFTSTGSLDTAFLKDQNHQGIIRAAYSEFSDVAVQPDGHIVAVGATGRFTTTALLARLNPDGSQDRQLLYSYSSSCRAYCQDAFTHVLAQPDGRLVMTANYQAPAPGLPDFKPLLMRFTPSLNFDKTFGADGSGVVEGDATNEGDPGKYTSVLQQKDGKLMVVGTASITRYFP